MISPDVLTRSTPAERAVLPPQNNRYTTSKRKLHRRRLVLCNERRSLFKIPTMSRSTSRKVQKKTVVVVPPKIGICLRTYDEVGNCEDEHWIDSTGDRETIREQFDELRLLLEDADRSPQPPQWKWSRPSRWPYDFRQHYFQFLDRNRLCSILVGDAVRGNAFDAVAEALRSNSDRPKVVARLRAALIDAALLAWPGDRSRAVREIAGAYSKAGLTPPRKQELREEVGKAAAEATKQSKSKPSDKSERLAED